MYLHEAREAAVRWGISPRTLTERKEKKHEGGRRRRTRRQSGRSRQREGAISQRRGRARTTCIERERAGGIPRESLVKERERERNCGLVHGGSGLVHPQLHVACLL